MSESASGSVAVGELGLIDEVVRLCRQIEALVASGAVDRIADETIDELLSVGVKLYAATQQGADAPCPPFPAQAVDPADIILVINHLLRVANVDPFELALWHAWGKA